MNPPAILQCNMVGRPTACGDSGIGFTDDRANAIAYGAVSFARKCSDREYNMELRHIRYALTVAREQNVTKAAQRLNISQSSVSDQIKALEQEIGFDLFKRTGRGVELTERGRQFLYEAERVARDVVTLEDAARRLRGADQTTLRIGIGSGLAPSLLPAMLAFGDKASPPMLEIRTAPTRVIFDELHAGSLDLGITVEVESERVPSGLTSERLFDSVMDLIAPRPFEGLRGKIVALEALADRPMIMSELSLGYGRIVNSRLTDLGIRPQIRAIVDNIETIKVMVQMGTGMALVPRGAAELERRLGLIDVRRTSPPCTFSIKAYRHRHSISERKALLIEAIVASTRR